MSRIVSEELDPFKGLKLATSKTPDSQIVSDGWGNSYEIPSEGYSKPVEYIDDVSVRYNFETKEVELLYKKEVLASQGLSAHEWFDGPDYWADEMYNYCRDDISACLKYMS